MFKHNFFYQLFEILFCSLLICVLFSFSSFAAQDIEPVNVSVRINRGNWHQCDTDADLYQYLFNNYKKNFDYSNDIISWEKGIMKTPGAIELTAKSGISTFQIKLLNGESTSNNASSVSDNVYTWEIDGSSVIRFNFKSKDSIMHDVKTSPVVEGTHHFFVSHKKEAATAFEVTIGALIVGVLLFAAAHVVMVVRAKKMLEKENAVRKKRTMERNKKLLEQLHKDFKPNDADEK